MLHNSSLSLAHAHAQTHTFIISLSLSLSLSLSRFNSCWSLCRENVHLDVTLTLIDMPRNKQTIKTKPNIYINKKLKNCICRRQNVISNFFGGRSFCSFWGFISFSDPTCSPRSSSGSVPCAASLLSKFPLI